MKKQSPAIQSFLLVAAGASSVVAAPGDYNTFQGSDTLELLTQNMLEVCNAIPQAANPVAGPGKRLEYLGGGSTTGEQGMRGTGTLGRIQTVAPMSRPLNNFAYNGAADACVTGDATKQMSVARDALLFVTSTSNFAGCQALRTTDTTLGSGVLTPALAVSDRNGVAGVSWPGSAGATSYQFADWKDTLKLAYFGLHNTQSASANTSVPDCNSDVRWELLSDIRNLSNDSAACAGGTTGCGEVKHLFRRDDVSGTTDTFRTLLGVHVNYPFCNYRTTAAPSVNVLTLNTDEFDQDPIRRTCEASDQVCGCDGKLGVVQAITIPAGTPASLLYGLPTCSGTRKYAPVADTIPGPTDKCLGGLTNAAGNPAQYNPFGTTCIVPATAAGSMTCRWANLPIQKSSCDNRVFNRQARNANGTFVVNPDNGRSVTNAVFRVKAACQELDATRQIGCLVNNYACSAGFAGFEAKTYNLLTTDGYALAHVPPTEANAHDFLDGTGTAATQYPFSRKLFLNTLDGFANLATATLVPGVVNPPNFLNVQGEAVMDNASLAACMADPTLYDFTAGAVAPRTLLDWAVAGYNGAMSIPVVTSTGAASTKALPTGLTTTGYFTPANGGTFAGVLTPCL